METTKELLIRNVKNWVRLDNEIRALKKEENKEKMRKKKLMIH